MSNDYGSGVFNSIREKMQFAKVVELANKLDDAIEGYEPRVVSCVSTDLSIRAAKTVGLSLKDFLEVVNTLWDDPKE